MMFTGEPVSASIEPAWAAKASGISSRDAGCRVRTAVTTTTGKSAATAPFTLISAVSTAHSQHHQHEQPPMTRSGVVDELLAGPRRDPGRVEGLADDEQRGDVDDGGITEPGERLVDVEHACRPQRERRADRHDLDRHPVGDEQHHHDSRARRRRSCCRPRDQSAREIRMAIHPIRVLVVPEPADRPPAAGREQGRWPDDLSGSVRRCRWGTRSTSCSPPTAATVRRSPRPSGWCPLMLAGSRCRPVPVQGKAKRLARTSNVTVQPCGQRAAR